MPLLNFVLITLLALFIVFSVIFLLTPFFSRVPFVPVRKRILKEVVAVLELRDDSMLYDLGCGDGRVLFSASKLHPKVSCVGVEIAPFPYLSAKIWSILCRAKNVSIHRADMFETDISSATHVFLYLFPAVMDSLLPKFEKELAKGTRVVSCDFQFKYKEPTKVVNLTSVSSGPNRTLFVYEF